MQRSQPTGEERRDLSLVDAAVGVQETETGNRFVGYSSVFNRRAAIGNPLKWGFYEQIADGAYTKTLAEGDQRFLLDHNPFYVVSRRSAGTLTQVPDATGLLVSSHLDSALSYVNDLKANIRNGNLTGMSIGFSVPEGKDEWTTETMQTRDGAVEVELRTIREMKLIENSAVTFPAYEDTTASLRHSLVPALLQRRDSDAIRRAATFRPDLAPLLGYAADLAPTVIDLHVDGKRVGEIPGEVLGHDTPITADAGAMEPFEERDPKKPYGNVAYADPGYQSDGVSRYPIDTKEHAKAAWGYINQADNAKNYTSEQLASIKSKIKAACKKFGVDISDDGRSQTTGDEPVEVREPGETTHTVVNEEDTEPAETTRRNPLRRQMARKRMDVLRVQHKLPA